MLHEILALAATLLAIALGPISRWFDARQDEKGPAKKVFGFALRRRAAKGKPKSEPRPAGPRVLFLFAIFVGILGAVTVVSKWNYLLTHRGEVLYFVWLVTAMVFGMFAQVLELNIREGRSWHRLTATELLLPTLFSIVVFYPIWSSTASGPHTFFSFYSAFLNGYFWKTIAASAKPPGRNEAHAAADKDAAEVQRRVSTR